MEETQEKEIHKNIKVSVRNLTKIFGKRPEEALRLVEKGKKKQEIFEDTQQTVALRSISFDVYEGELFVLMGLSGCGKSTLLRCINRLIEPTSGTVEIDGVNIVEMDEDELRQVRRTKIGMIFQNFALLPHRTILDNVGFGLEIQDMSLSDREKKAREAIDLVGLSGYEESYPSGLSGGMQQRVGLARALASDADILLMDEAFSALDPMIRRDMQDELIELQARLNKTIIFVSHDLDEALKLGDRIALMKDGIIAQLGTAEDLLQNPRCNYVERFVEDVNLSRVLVSKDVMKRPEPLLPPDSGPRNALRLMEEYGISSIFVAGKDRIFRGLVTVDGAVDAKKREIPLRDVMITDTPTVLLDTPAQELMPIMAETAYPVAVLDDVGRIKGLIVRGSLLAGLARLEIEV
ncbi:glycine betaine/L-proline ABC transporter ATP-binding protein [Methanogenium marinum]|uniref:Glycine betaine/L-proline ABC transporter ATP-binding protein n=1 Tax=Methanogenium marinum TaxID=348610 RepID=A0A9Q4KQE4_9EURY|nr:glycine betaine/L-proline ABC transporter ATP-binding protein [Methanogenium marinum]MDE4908405.1 glycine betaine/L-proline ABC transporter ATP-binding protein [Methanogenium marinum]